MSHTRFIDPKEAFALLEALPASALKEAMLDHLDAFSEFVEEGLSRIVLYEGDTTLPYLAVKDDIVIVNGNLTVNGILEDGLEVDVSLLLVLGHVTTQQLFTFSQICILGNLTVVNAIVADSICDYSLNVGGDIKAQLILESGHWFDIQGTVTADHIYAWHSSQKRKGILATNLTDDDLPEEVKTDERLDLSKAMQRLMNNQPILPK